MAKCSICKKNEAVIYTTKIENGISTHEGICLICAFEKGYTKLSGLDEILEQQGIRADNVAQIQEAMNEAIAAMGTDDPQKLFNWMMQNPNHSMSIEDLQKQLAGNLNPSPSTNNENAAEKKIDEAIDAFMNKWSASGSDEKKSESEHELENSQLDETAIAFATESNSPQNGSGEASIHSPSDPSTEGENKEENPENSSNISIDSMLTVDAESEDDYEDDEADDFTQMMPFSASELMNTYDQGAASEESFTSNESSDGSSEEAESPYKCLEKFAKNLNRAALRGELDPLIGRDQELQRVIQILNRRQKNNPVLLGEPGVGKTAIAEGLAQRIVQRDVPAKLLDLEIYLVDIAAMVAGTQFRGQFESRLKGLVEDSRKHGNVVLAIDEVHSIIGAGDADGSLDAANILKPALSRGEIRILGSTTLDEYRRYIEKDSALERRFQQVIVEEPSVEESINILMGNKSYYETHHHVRFPASVIREAVQLSNRYITERFLPDKAIDVIDEAGSRANLENPYLPKIHEIEKTMKAAQLFLKRLSDRGPELGKEEAFYELQAEKKGEIARCEKRLHEINAINAPKEISSDDIAAVISMWTSIPLERLQQSQAQRLLDLEKHIHERLIGQDEAVSAIARAIRRHRAGLGPRHKPASFIFVGPTGVGKTELVKALAEAMFDREDAYVRLDMSEYMEPHTVSKLIGSPPGYVGYDDAGQLSEKIRRKPYSVILLDEIEKAHSDVFNLLLQVLDEGRLTDSHGRVVNFENTIIIMTSNAGSSMKANSIGFGNESYIALEERAQTALKSIFRPEFLNRVDEVIVFHELSSSELRKIVNLMLHDVQESLENYHLTLELTEDVIEAILESSYTSQYGARPLRKTITRWIENPLADALIAKKLDGKSKVVVSMSESWQNLKNKQEGLHFDYI
ncbi:MAG: ATP-dependent Clp protease ATP-binding subunit [Eubacteriales bacterium]|nr:ATP-dependent Clp protease ATP-binding subunit [Eubacteriales bacterium]